MSTKRGLVFGLSAFLLFLGVVRGANSHASGPITFEKDVAPILQQHCNQCHHPAGIAPMSFVNYDEARPWARSMKEKVVTRVMPPFYAAGPIGYFDSDPRLTDE